MAKVIRVQLFAQQGAATPEPRRIVADTVEEDKQAHKLRFKKDGQSVGELSSALVMGWWIEDEG